MDFNITVRGLEKADHERTEGIRNYITDKFARLQKLLLTEQQPVYVDIIVTINSPHPHHQVELRIAEPRYHLIVKREDAELYRAIDEVLDIGHTKLANHKDELIENARREGYIQKIKDRSL